MHKHYITRTLYLFIYFTLEKATPRRNSSLFKVDTDVSPFFFHLFFTHPFASCKIRGDFAAPKLKKRRVTRVKLMAWMRKSH